MKDSEESKPQPWLNVCVCSCSGCASSPPFHCFISSNGCEA